jgi:hypothetical protein
MVCPMSFNDNPTRECHKECAWYLDRDHSIDGEAGCSIMTIARCLVSVTGELRDISSNVRDIRSMM